MEDLARPNEPQKCSPVLILVGLGYFVLLLLIWLDEAVDLPALLLGDEPSDFSWQAIVLHAGVVTVVAVPLGLAIARLQCSRKNAGVALEEMADRLKTLAEHTRDWAFWQSPEGDFLYSSPSCLRITGYGPVEFAEDHSLLEDIVHEDDREAYLAHRESAHEERQPGETRFRILRRDGEMRWIGHVCQPIFDRNQRFLGMRGSNRDITAERLAEEAVEKSEAHLNRAQKVASIGSWDLDLAAGRLYWSEEVYRIFGVCHGTPLDYPAFLETLFPEDREFVDKKWREALAGKPYDIEHRIRVGEEVRWVREKAEVEFNEAGRALRGVGIVQNITDLKAAEAEAARLENELNHLTRVSTLGEFSAALAHELNQPLAAILSNSQAALRFLDADDVDMAEIREILEDIVADDQRARGIIQKLREMTRKPTEWLNAESLAVNPLVEDVLKLVRGDLIMRGVTLEEDLRDGLPLVSASAVQIQQALLNLILNALEAMEQVEDRTLVISTRDSGNGTVELTVSDTGPGFEPGIKEQVFKPFLTTKEAGMGMGLAICRALIEKHGGRIRAEDAPEGGARFVISLPALREAKG
jgi:PAS domain S-box-containing protein